MNPLHKPDCPKATCPDRHKGGDYCPFDCTCDTPKPELPKEKLSNCCKARMILGEYVRLGWRGKGKTGVLYCGKCFKPELPNPLEPEKESDWERRVVSALRAIGNDDHIPAILSIFDHELSQVEKEAYERGRDDRFEVDFEERNALIEAKVAEARKEAIEECIETIKNWYRDNPVEIIGGRGAYDLIDRKKVIHTLHSLLKDPEAITAIKKIK